MNTIEIDGKLYKLVEVKPEKKDHILFYIDNAEVQHLEQQVDRRGQEIHEIIPWLQIRQEDLPETERG